MAKKIKVKSHTRVHNPNKGKKGNSKNKPKTQSGPKYDEKANLYKPHELLGEKALRRTVGQEVQRQIRPALRQTNRTIGELNKYQNRDVTREALLGRQAAQNTTTYYQQLAQQETALLANQQGQNAQLTGQVAGAVNNAQAQIGQAGVEASKGIGAYEGQNIGSRERLAQMIAEQGAQAAREGAAINAQAQGQGSSQQALLAALSGSNAMHGGEQLAEQGREVGKRIGDIRNTYGENIGKLNADKRELLKSIPELRAKALNELRESERNFYLSKGALGLEKKKFSAEASGKSGGIGYSNVNTKNQLKVLKLKKKNRMAELDRLGATEEQRNAEDHRFREKELEWQEKMSSGKDSGGAGGWQPFDKVYSYLRGSPVKPETLLKSKQARQAAYDKLRANGASDKNARKAIKKYIKKYRAKKIAGRHKIDIF
jgi:hypothetical protein